MRTPSSHQVYSLEGLVLALASPGQVQVCPLMSGGERKTAGFRPFSLAAYADFIALAPVQS